MVLSLEVEDVMAEVRAQKKARDIHLDGIKLLIDGYPGLWWSNGGQIDRSGWVDSFDPENTPFEYVSYEMTQLVWANPRWSVTTRRPRAQQMVAEAMQWAMNRWTVDSDLKTVLEDLAVDYSFAWGVAHVSAQPTTETYEAEDPVLSPQMSRISPFDFGFDHRAPSMRRARMQWHRYRIDKEDLVDRAQKDRAKPRHLREGWDLSAIRSLHETAASDSQLRSHHWGEGLGAGYDEPDRKQVEVCESYFPGLQLPGKPGPEDGFNGTLATYGVGGGSDDRNAVMIRPPRPYFGPRWGPYTLIGAYIVPDSPFPLSPLAAAAGNIEQASRLAKAVDAQVAAFKRMGITSDGVLAKLIQSGKNEHVYTAQLPNLRETFVELTVGGTDAANVAAEQRVIAKRDRILGFAENQRGTTTGDTATDVTYANESAQARQGYRRGRYQDGIRRAGKTAAYLMYHTDEIVFPLGLDAIEALGLDEDEEAWFMGGSFDEGSGTTFDDLGLEVEPHSMERPSEGLLRSQGQLLANVAQMAPALPMLAQVGADVKGFLNAYGEAFGMPNLARLFPGIDSVDLAAIQPAEAEPRLAKDVGVAGLRKLFEPKGLIGGSSSKNGSPAPKEFAGAGSMAG